MDFKYLLKITGDNKDRRSVPYPSVLQKSAAYGKTCTGGTFQIYCGIGGLGWLTSES